MDNRHIFIQQFITFGLGYKNNSEQRLIIFLMYMTKKFCALNSIIELLKYYFIHKII